MNKFKKIFYTICLVLLLGGLIALGVCYYVMPIKTTMAFDKFVELLNTPIGIIGGTTITLGLVGAIVLKVVLDLHKNGIRKDIEQIKKLKEEKVEEAKQYLEQAERTMEEVKVIINSNKEQIDFLVAKMVEICQTIPNAKVQAIAKSIEEHYIEEQKECSYELMKLHSDLSKYIEDKVDTKELVSKYNDLLDLVRKLEEQYGKGTND